MAARRSPLDHVKKFYSFKTDFPVVDRSLIETAPIRLRASAVVGVPPEVAFRLLADQSSWSSWYPTIKSVEWTSAPYAEGSTRLVKRRGRPSYTQQVIEWEEPFRMAFCLVEGREPGAEAAVEEFLLRPTAPGTSELTWQMGIQPAGIGKALAPIMSGIMSHHPFAGRMQSQVPIKFAAYVARTGARYAS